MATRVTIHDVARSAGVSTATVSNALSGNGRLSATTRDRVARIASELGYSASPSARGLRTRRVGANRLYLPRDTGGVEDYMELAAGAAVGGVGDRPALDLIPTPDRVARIASELGYSASPSARGLRTRRVGAIGLYLPRHTVGFEYYMELAAGAAIEAMGHGLALTLIPAPDDGRVVRLHVDGVIVSDPIVGDPVDRKSTRLNSSHAN